MSGWGRKPADFFVSRVVRLVPAYWAATVVTAIVLMALPRLTSGVAPVEVLTNLTMVQSAFGVPNLDPAFWTLLVELMFYLMFGLIAFWGITYRRMIAFCVLWSVAAFIGAASHNEVLNMLFSPPYSPYFVAGIAFFLIYRFGGNLLLWAIVAYSWLVALNLPHTNPPWQVSVTVSSFFVVMALVATHKLDGIRWRWLTLAGALTYPLYLLHQDIGFTVFEYLRRDVPPVLLVILTLIGMLALSWLIHLAVERPLAPILKTKLAAAVGTMRAAGPRAAPASPPAVPVHKPARCAAASGHRGGTSRSARLHAARPASPAPAVRSLSASAPAVEPATMPVTEPEAAQESGPVAEPARGSSLSAASRRWRG
jgi:peptidoglycan/LPS O-acetylase OafA/YrhL